MRDSPYAGYLCKDKSDSGVRKILEDGLIPLDRLLVETDSPFMYPNTRASKLPAHVKEALTERYVLYCISHVYVLRRIV
jgi:TatD DNase family protein